MSNGAERLAMYLFDADALGAPWDTEPEDTKALFRDKARRVIEACGLVPIDDPRAFWSALSNERAFNLLGHAPKMAGPWRASSTGNVQCYHPDGAFCTWSPADPAEMAKRRKDLESAGFRLVDRFPTGTP